MFFPTLRYTTFTTSVYDYPSHFKQRKAMRICYSPPVTRDTTDPAITDAPVFRIPRVSNTNDIASLQADYAYVTPQSQKPGEKAAHFLYIGSGGGGSGCGDFLGIRDGGGVSCTDASDDGNVGVGNNTSTCSGIFEMTKFEMIATATTVTVASAATIYLLGDKRVDAVRQIVVGEMITTATTCTASAAIIDLLGDNSVSDMWVRCKDLMIDEAWNYCSAVIRTSVQELCQLNERERLFFDFGFGIICNTIRNQNV